ncbi:flagellar biosynthesis protein FlhF [Lysinibacillus endophyticus]|uniref:flagellar biosynthesis protein FlhF n=1 Tax=Ureibacillus endophyticus TaxID=1978490 RepID=UPI00209DB998|nr:flagellar biosynthesis protein FlhF [Lysinibacillus endophyticus]MCP1144062.1 flagellar biosynthesis protein FlhF [Lysinibacillus endophyticus]
MKMKKYVAPSISEAMKQIRTELGDDAVIINSKVVVTKKFFGLIKHKNFEVLAGVDSVESVNLPSHLPDMQHRNVSNSEMDTVSEKEMQNTDLKLTTELKSEIADLKSILQSIQKQTTHSDIPEEILPMIDFLKRQELNEELITAISDELFVYYKKAENINIDEIKSITKDVLKKYLTQLPIGGLSFEKKYINVLGPTGVGKTTTIAKIAARSVLEKKKKIGFITTDTYRIAAIEQLKTYANLLHAPVEIVYNANDYKTAIEKMENLDLVFIDTAGRNYKEAKYVNDLKKIINFDDDVESYLVLSLTSKEQDMEAIIQQFHEFPIGKFIFTKIDETNSIGTMYNLMIKYNKGLAYYTNGQEVPEDIEEANIDKLIELFFQGEFQ